MNKFFLLLGLKQWRMNFLAHVFLSGDNTPLTIGNFIGDFVKGKAFEAFDLEIKNGILLHREIDQYTDQHEVVLQSKQRLRPKYRHYAPVITDIFYDHFLASLWGDYHTENLLSFTEKFYTSTKGYLHIIPNRARDMLKYMKQGNWLFNYQYLDGINRALTGISQRTSFESKMEYATQDLKHDYDAYKTEFKEFFPDLITFSKSVTDSF